MELLSYSDASTFLEALIREEWERRHGPLTLKDLQSSPAGASGTNYTVQPQSRAALYAGKELTDGPRVLNALAWYAGEETARAFCDLDEANA